MKRIILFIFTIAVCLLGACKKDSPATASQMSAVINLRPWVSYGTSVKFDKTAAVNIIIDADSSKTHMNLQIANYTGAGTYVIADSGNTASYTSYTNALGSALHTATSGKIVVTNSTTNGYDQNGIKGTFEFLADTVQVTGGAFNVDLHLN